MSEKKEMTLARFVAQSAVIALMVLCSILVNIYGWGLTPKSWWWIIGVGFFVFVVLRRMLDEL